MTRTDSTGEDKELRRSVLQLIESYRMGAVLDARDLCVRKIRPEASQQQADGRRLAPASR
jgi:hypothetical protein